MFAYRYARFDISTPIDQVMNPFEKVFMTRGGPSELALFHSRSEDGKAHGFLVPEVAFKVAPELDLLANWQKIGGPLSDQWALLIGHADAWAAHGVPEPRP